MKILLIYPYFLEKRINEEEISVVPIGVYYIAALLREHGYDAEILNWHSVDKNSGLIEKTLKEKRPDVIGFSIFSANRWGGIEIAGIARQACPGVSIVFGGPGATFLWEHLLTHFSEVDFIVLGEGEQIFLNLVKSLDHNQSTDGIRGLAFRKNKRPFKNRDACPVDDIDSLPDPSKYFLFQHVSSTRGCPGNCSFCGSRMFWGPAVRSHSPRYFVDQLQRLNRKGVTFFFISDDTFTLDKDRIIKICREILERGLEITWVAISRVDCVSEEILYWMRRAGCIQISYGIESGSESIRGLLNKNISRARAIETFRLTRRYGIMPRAYFIYGSPGETMDTIKETLDMIRDIKPLSVIFYILALFPGTRLYHDFLKKSGENNDIWLNKMEDLLYFETDPAMAKDDVLAFGATLREGYYSLLPGFADPIELIDDATLYPRHAEFLSRLAMTFSHGDYSAMEEIKGKNKLALRLFRKALSYSPDHRAFLGLGMMLQKKGNFERASQILKQGIEHHPESEILNICLGVNLMNMGEFQMALPYFLKFRGSQEAASYAARCYEALERQGVPAGQIRTVNKRQRAKAGKHGVED